MFHYTLFEYQLYSFTATLNKLTTNLTALNRFVINEFNFHLEKLNWFIKFLIVFCFDQSWAFFFFSHKNINEILNTDINCINTLYNLVLWWSITRKVKKINACFYRYKYIHQFIQFCYLINTCLNLNNLIESMFLY